MGSVLCMHNIKTIYQIWVVLSHKVQSTSDSVFKHSLDLIELLKFSFVFISALTAGGIICILRHFLLYMKFVLSYQPSLLVIFRLMYQLSTY